MNKEQKKNYIAEMTTQFENSKAVMNAKSGQVEIRNDKDGNIGVSTVSYTHLTLPTKA